MKREHYDSKDLRNSIRIYCLQNPFGVSDDGVIYEFLADLKKFEPLPREDINPFVYYKGLIRWVKRNAINDTR